MEDIWEDFLDNFDEAEEVPEPEPKKAKLIEPKEPKKVLNPRPKLDADRILSEDRGLPNLLKMMTKITFREGSEVEDMKKTMFLMEQWSHGVFPKFNFDDFLIKCEDLGKKRPVKTHLRKVRLGLTPI